MAATAYRITLRDWLIVLITLAVYVPAMRAGFIWSDRDAIEDNPNVREYNSLGDIWRLDGLLSRSPVVETMHWAGWQLWEGNSRAFHVCSVVLHALNALLVYHLLRRLVVPGAWAAALLFAVHPVNVQAVAWISQCHTPLAAMCFLLAALCLLRTNEPRWYGWYAAAMAFFTLALLGRAFVAPLPIVWLACLGLRDGRIRGRDWLLSLPLIALAALILCLKYRGTALPISEHPAASLATAGWAAWFYLGKAVLPWKLIFIYPEWRIATQSITAWLPLGALIGVLAALVIARRGPARPVLAGFGFFFLMVLPCLGLLPLRDLKYAPVADTCQYLAIIGIAGLAAAVAARWAKATPRATRVAVVPAGLVVAGLSGLTWAQGKIYLDEETLWQDTLARNPQAYIAHGELGVLRYQSDKLDEAAEHFRAAIRIKPEDPTGYDCLAQVYLDMDEPRRAAATLADLVLLRPDEAGAHTKLGELLLQLHDAPLAVTHWRHAARLTPDDAQAQNSLAWALATHPDARVRNGTDAIAFAQRAVTLTEREDASYVDTLAAAYAEAGRFDEAVATQREAVSLANGDFNPRLLREMNDRIGLFASHKAYREDPTAERRPATRPTHTRKSAATQSQPTK